MLITLLFFCYILGNRLEVSPTIVFDEYQRMKVLRRRPHPCVIPIVDAHVFPVVDAEEYNCWEMIRSYCCELWWLGQGSERGRLQDEIFFFRKCSGSNQAARIHDSVGEGCWTQFWSICQMGQHQSGPCDAERVRGPLRARRDRFKKLEIAERLQRSRSQSAIRKDREIQRRTRWKP